MILLDTHAAIWMANVEPMLGKTSRATIVAARDESELAISAISFWEIALLVSKRRLALHDSAAALRNQLLGTGVKELPLTGDIALMAVELKYLHGNPADRFIVATAIVHYATLITADANILKWKHALRRQDAEA